MRSCVSTMCAQSARRMSTRASTSTFASSSSSSSSSKSATLLNATTRQFSAPSSSSSISARFLRRSRCVANNGNARFFAAASTSEKANHEGAVKVAHILVDATEPGKALLSEFQALLDGQAETFEGLAKLHSKCPSGARGA